MGWWKVMGTDNTIGDDPLDVLEEAVAVVVAQYQEAFGRRPSRGEWETLLHAVLASATGEERVTDSGAVAKVLIEMEPVPAHSPSV